LYETSQAYEKKKPKMKKQKKKPHAHKKECKLGIHKKGGHTYFTLEETP
jgi:hypothetical protein